MELSFIAWLVATYVLVLVSVGVDFVSGVRKSVVAGVPLRSRIYKKTCDKAVKYFMPMLCLSCIDYLGSVFVSFPALTMAMGGFDIFCEWKSVMETIHDKQEIKRASETMRIIIENRDDLLKGLAEILGNMSTNVEKEVKDENNQ